MSKKFMDYTFHEPPQNMMYHRSMVVFSSDEKKVKVSDILTALDCMLSFIATCDTSIRKYKIALKFFNFLKYVFTNKKPTYLKPTKEEMNLLVDVIEEFALYKAKSEEEKKDIAIAVFVCKLLIGVTYE